MRRTITKRSEFPKCVRQFKELKGICVGSCIDPFDVSFDRYNYPAHAHIEGTIGRSGWICLRDQSLLNNKPLLLHEVAHLIAGNITPTLLGHGKRWRDIVVRIGGSLEPYYVMGMYGDGWSYVNIGGVGKEFRDGRWRKIVR